MRLACAKLGSERIEQSMDVFAKGMHEHMLLIQELREIVRALRDVIKENNQRNSPSKVSLKLF